MLEKKFCKCGKRISQSRAEAGLPCGVCHKKRMAEAHAKAQAIVDSGKCPECGAALTRNSALAGWWQCVQYGNWKNRKGDPLGKDCGFQCFTE